MKTLIQNGTLVSDCSIQQGDLLLENGKIAAIGQALPMEGAEVINAAGKLVFPGFIDAHTHMDLPVSGTVTADDFSSGTKCAILGGTTCIVDFATQDFGETLGQGLANWQEKATGKSSCDYAFHMAISQWREDIRDELPNMIKQGISSFKIYMTYGNRVNDREIYEILSALKPLGGIVGVHCENNGMIEARVKELLAAGKTAPSSHPLAHPDESEGEAIHRLLSIARLVDVPVVVVHLSTQKGLEEIRRARAMGQTVYVESCPQYFLLEDSAYAQPDFQGAKYICSPPLRKKSDQAALWEGLNKGEIDTISTDHCSFTLAQKDAGRENFSKIPGGMPGVEERVGLMFTYGVEQGWITLPQLVKHLSTNPARLYGMYPQKGALLPGSDGDVVIWNPVSETTLTDTTQHTAAGYTPYAGWTLKGQAETVFLRGKKVVDHGNLVCPNQGIYIPRTLGSL
jgi:dihydropyrimidinase